MPPFDIKERLQKEWKNIIGIVMFCVIVSAFLSLNDNAQEFEKGLLILHSTVAGVVTIGFGIAAFLAFSNGRNPGIYIIRIIIINALLLVVYNASIHVYNDRNGTNLQDRESLKQDSTKAD